MASGIGVPDPCPEGTILLNDCKGEAAGTRTCYFRHSRNRILLVDGTYRPEVRDSNGMESSCQYVHYVYFEYNIPNTWTYNCETIDESNPCYLLANPGCDLSGTEICYGSCKY